MRALLVILLLCGIGYANKPKLSAADQKKYASALRKGRELQAKKKYVEAMAALDDALATSKDDATVLAEMGWTAYLAKDLEKAEEYTKRAIANEATRSWRDRASAGCTIATNLRRG